MESRHYFVHGLSVESEIPLPALEVRGLSAPDVRVRRGDRAPGTEHWGKEVIAARDEPFRFRIFREGTDYLADLTAVEFGWSAGTRQMTVRPQEATPAELSSLLLMGVGLVLPATLQGRFVLHASALARKGDAIAILGRPGSGKSTLALCLCSFGWSLLADDALAVVDQGVPWALRGACELRLRAHAPRCEPMAKSVDVRSSFDGRCVVRPKRMAPAAGARLGGLFFPRFIEDGPAVTANRLHPRDVAVRLLANLRVGSWCDAAILASQTSLAASIARKVPGFELSLRRSDGAAMDATGDLCRAIESCLKS